MSVQKRTFEQIEFEKQCENAKTLMILNAERGLQVK